RCEVKTIQSIGEIEHRELGGFRFSQKSVLSLTAAIRDDLEKAKEQTTNGGMIFIAPWSYRINALLRRYFHSQLALYPPPPSHNLTVLVLTTNKAFEDEYVTFNTSTVLSDLITAFDMIEAYG